MNDDRKARMNDDTRALYALLMDNPDWLDELRASALQDVQVTGDGDPVELATIAERVRLRMVELIDEQIKATPASELPVLRARLRELATSTRIDWMELTAGIIEDDER